MATNSVKISELDACTAPKAADLLVITANVAGTTNTFNVTVEDLLQNSSTDLASNTMIVTGNDTPANSSDIPSGVSVGSMWFDGDYIYVVTSNTVVKRVALSTF